jgi:hypothetical protein
MFVLGKDTIMNTLRASASFTVLLLAIGCSSSSPAPIPAAEDAGKASDTRPGDPATPDSNPGIDYSCKTFCDVMSTCVPATCEATCESLSPLCRKCLEAEGCDGGGAGCDSACKSADAGSSD